MGVVWPGGFFVAYCSESNFFWITFDNGVIVLGGDIWFQSVLQCLGDNETFPNSFI